MNPLNYMRLHDHSSRNPRQQWTNASNGKISEDLGLRYIFDAAGDPQDHAELMTGVNATWYEVRRNIDRLPDFVNPEKNPADFSEPIRARLARWLEERVKSRLEG